MTQDGKSKEDAPEVRLIPERPGSRRMIPERLRVPYRVKSKEDTHPGYLKTFRSKAKKLVARPYSVEVAEAALTYAQLGTVTWGELMGGQE